METNVIGKDVAELDPTKNIKSFKKSADVENFYRFIHENDLRREAKSILEAIKVYFSKKKKRKRKSRTKKVLN